MKAANGSPSWKTCSVQPTCVEGDGVGGTEEQLPGVVQTVAECMELVKSMRPNANGATVSNPQRHAMLSTA